MVYRCLLILCLTVSIARAEDAAIAGHLLLSQHNCTACHAADAKSLPKAGAPLLTDVTSRISPAYLEKFIADPHAARPGTAMPDVLGKMTKSERQDAAAAFVDYLRTLGEAKPFQLTAIDPKAAERGLELFNDIGCAVCHDDDLESVKDRYSLTSLTEFLEDPLAVRPGGTMPDMKLTHWEAVDLASHLLLDQRLRTEPQPEPKRAAEGKQLFAKHGCVQCHQPDQAKSDFATPLVDLDPERSCSAAVFEHSPAERKQIAAAIANPIADPSPEEQIHLTMTRLNCIACHSRGDVGGPTPELDEFFTTTNLNLGEQARIPPSLTGVGAKLKSPWLRKVLVSGASSRPYMNTRMPKFGVANVEALIDLFAQADRLPELEIDRVKDQKVARTAGHELVGTKNLACVACHTFNGESATTLAGMELADMTSRLQENWFHHYLRDPQKFHSSTIMPSFWPAGKPTRPEILEANTSQQINAIWQYLARGREARMPHGIKREPIEYGPTGPEAVILRRQYHGIGKRGIGVGYGAGINLSFDAGQGRLGSIWRGGFGEMSGVWGGQGSGKVKEQSRDVVRFPIGPAFAVLEDADEAWPVFEEAQRVPDFQFKGYELDARLRPSFVYKIGEASCKDSFIDKPGGPSLERTIVIDHKFAPGTYFRVAADKDLAPEIGGKIYQLPRGLFITVPKNHIFRESRGMKELLIPVWALDPIKITYAFRPQP